MTRPAANGPAANGPASGTSTTRSRGIDVLRGVAVALVMARHAFPDVFPGAGVVGVVMFFALSGHLITTGLLDEQDRTGRIAFAAFYRRRAVRLVPALLCWLVVFSLVVLALDPLGDRASLPGTWLVASTWTANLPLGVDVSSAAFHLWTLAGEEQFYLVWPVLVGFALVRGRGAELMAVAVVLCALGLAATAGWLGPAADLAYVLPTSWAVCFVVGGASALLWRSGPPWVPGPWVQGLAWGSLLVLALLPVRGSWWTYTVVAPLVAVLACVLVLAARSDVLHLPNRVPVAGRVGDDWAAAGVDAMVWLGRRSYAAYLWNYPIALWLRGVDVPLVWDAAAGVALTLVAAELSWRGVEQPASRRWPSRPTSGTAQPVRERDVT